MRGALPTPSLFSLSLPCSLPLLSAQCPATPATPSSHNPPPRATPSSHNPPTSSRPLLAPPSQCLSHTRSGDADLHGRDPPRAGVSLASDLQMPISTVVTHLSPVSLYADLSFSFSFRFSFFFFLLRICGFLIAFLVVYGGLR